MRIVTKQEPQDKEHYVLNLEVKSAQEFFVSYIEHNEGNKEFNEEPSTKTLVEETLSLDDLFIYRNGVDFFLEDNKLVSYGMKEQHHVRDGQAQLRVPPITERLFSVFFGDTKAEALFISWKPLNTKASYTVDTTNKHAGLLAAEQFPQLTNQANAVQYKIQILKEFDAHKVLSYLEAQVDLLSTIVKFMVEKNPEIKQQLNDFIPVDKVFDAINENNVTNVKAVDSCLDEILTSKARLRELQKLYLDTKNGRHTK